MCVCSHDIVKIRERAAKILILVVEEAARVYVCVCEGEMVHMNKVQISRI
jgi:hypothetical protein